LLGDDRAREVAVAGWSLAAQHAHGHVSLRSLGPGGGRVASCGVGAIGDGYGLAVSADGRLFALDSPGPGGGGLEVWEAETGRIVARLPAGGRQPAFTPDGQSVCALSRSSAVIWRLPTGGGAEGLVRLPDGGRCTALALGPDGRQLAAAGTRPDEVFLWIVPEGHPVAHFQLGETLLSPPAFGPDGHAWVATRGALGLRLSSLTPGLPLCFASGLPWPHQDRLRSMAFAPDGRALAACDERDSLCVWSLPGPGGPPALLAEGQEVWRCAWLPDGRLLTFSRLDGAVNLWPAEAFRW
jgi:WD40 repeat protein